MDDNISFFLSMNVHFFFPTGVNKEPNLVYFQHLGNWVLPLVCAKLGAKPIYALF
jgi:hypothetical protein